MDFVWLANRSHIYSLIPLVLEKELDKLKSEISQKYVSVLMELLNLGGY